MVSLRYSRKGKAREDRRLPGGGGCEPGFEEQVASRHGSEAARGLRWGREWSILGSPGGGNVFGFYQAERRDMCSLSPGTVFASGLEDGAVD